ncbi:NADP-dependent glyceraldehyde-3-phosphate dehydrogenase [Brevibacillus laterosporus]|uniref:NADP-dependent glyceraldehyde-3-phosphate dehydrogenase n=1 Tax=Brevibacillus laterosporus TaxID=1465 RepID=UPI000839B2EA|nr:NADP-dependent glyceraldehyde-3-phosphate dehydrogenase [Brevibacillus laterosporus]
MTTKAAPAHMQLPYYINGEWRNSSSNETVKIYSPYKDGVVGEVQAITREEVDEAIKLAAEAQKAWAELSIRERATYLYRWIDELLAMKDEIADIMMQEVGKTFADAQKEVERSADLIRYNIEEAIHMYNESMNGENFPGGSKQKIAIVERVPLGVVLAISPFNYPVNLSSAKIAPALMMGNAVIFKPATQGALSGIKMIEALHKAGIPKNIVNVVTGRGSVIGDYLVEHKGINMITFTGGTATGYHIASKAKMVPLVMELGGKDPAIVLPDADLKLATGQIISGAYSYSGQRCTAIKRVLVQDEVADQLTDMLAAEVAKLSIGSPEDKATVVPVIDTKSADYIQGLIDDAIEKGAKVLTGNKREGNLIHPTLLADVTLDMRVAWEEPFGPVLPIIRIKDAEEAIEIANKSEFGLQASVFTNDINKAFHLAKKLETGSVQINGRTERGPDHFPFIGVKGSGVGVQGVPKSLQSMTRDKVTVLNLQ